MRTNLTIAPEQFAFLASVVRYRGNAVQPHGERFVWSDATTPRTERPVRFIPSNRYRSFAPLIKRHFGDSFTIRWA